MKKGLALIALTAAFGCGSESLPLEINGRWASNFGESLMVSDTTIGPDTILSYDNSDNYLIAQSPPDDMFTPNKFKRIVWTELSNGQFHHCMIDFDLDSADAAEASDKPFDASDPDAGGCDGFPWSRFMEHIEIEGSWSSAFGDETIASFEWDFGYGISSVVEYDNEANFAITQVSEDDMFNPSKFSKIVWTDPSTGSFHYCTVDFGRETALEAKTSTQTADAADVSGAGCGGFPWTELSQR